MSNTQTEKCDRLEICVLSITMFQAKVHSKLQCFIYAFVSIEKTYELCSVKESEECFGYLCSFKHTVTQIFH